MITKTVTIIIDAKHTPNNVGIQQVETFVNGKFVGARLTPRTGCCVQEVTNVLDKYNWRCLGCKRVLASVEYTNRVIPLTQSDTAIQEWIALWTCLSYNDLTVKVENRS